MGVGHNKHISSACSNCRRRKVKCDGKQACSNCMVSQLDCVYNVQSDLRRLSAKKVIQNLQIRVSQLEAVLKAHNIAVPPELEQDVLPTSLAALPVPGNNEDDAAKDQDSESSFPQTDPAASAPENAILEPFNPEPADPATTSGNIATHLSPSHSSPSNTQSATPAPPVFASTPVSMVNHLRQQEIQPQVVPHSNNIAFDLDSSQEGQSDTGSDITDLLAARIGSLRIAEDGQLRYYGPTSNLHVHQNGFQSLSPIMIRNVATEGDEVLRNLGLDREIPEAVETHLANLYFCWEDPAIHVVDQDTFFAERYKYRRHGQSTAYYSETLNNAICAIGANLASSEILDLPEPASEFFSRRAKALLDIEMDSPTVATVQALVVMSASEAAFMRDARGWLYSGMAARLSQDLGLHLDVTAHVRRGTLTERDLEIRKTAFWGVFIHENMWGLYVGRPGEGTRDITVSRPDLRADQFNGRMWKPYPTPSGRATIPEQGIFFSIHSCTAANITLCEFMRRINSTLYSGRTIASDLLIKFRTDTKLALQRWKENLPASLRSELSNPEKPHVPAVLQLHMQYHATMVSLCRPYMSNHLVRTNGSDQNPQQMPGDTVREARDDCVEAAHQVANVLRSYKRQHSLQRLNIQIVHIVFTAALVFIHDICTRTPHESRVSLGDLQFCCHALGEIGQSYGNATRALEVIILVKGQWQQLAAIRQGRRPALKRSSFIIDDDAQQQAIRGSHQSKRRHRPSMATSDSLDIDPSVLWSTPSFTTFYQTVGDGVVGQQADPHINQYLHETSTDTGVFTAATNLDNIDSIMAPLGWLEGQQPLHDVNLFEPMKYYENLTDMQDTESTAGLVAEGNLDNGKSTM